MLISLLIYKKKNKYREKERERERSERKKNREREGLYITSLLSTYYRRFWTRCKSTSLVFTWCVPMTSWSSRTALSERTSLRKRSLSQSQPTRTKRQDTVKYGLYTVRYELWSSIELSLINSFVHSFVRLLILPRTHPLSHSSTPPTQLWFLVARWNGLEIENGSFLDQICFFVFHSFVSPCIHSFIPAFHSYWVN